MAKHAHDEYERAELAVLDAMCGPSLPPLTAQSVLKYFLVALKAKEAAQTADKEG